MPGTASILQRYLSGQCSASEKTQVEGWYLQELKRRSGTPLPGFDYGQAGADMWQVIETRTRPLPQQRRYWLRYAAAALVLTFLGAALYLLFTPKATPPQLPVTITDVAPGTSSASLMLADGTVIPLNEAKNGQVARQQGTAITKLQNGRLLYEASGPGGVTATNIISTPRGGQYQVTLPDGSNVWLNAASSLTFPAAFAQSGQRHVVLQGEAYFEATHDAARPFVVETRGQQVQVLGTSFNVNAYTDEESVTTTLLTGSVKVISTRFNTDKHLSPGQSAILGSHHLSVQPADLQTALAWKNGKLSFRNADLPRIMRQVSRWYNIEVAFEGDIPRRTFTGAIARTANLSSLLEILKTNNIHFTLTTGANGKRLVITNR